MRLLNRANKKTVILFTTMCQFNHIISNLHIFSSCEFALCIGDLPNIPVHSQNNIYEPDKLLTEHVITLSLIKSYQLEFHVSRF